jgi:hypothetical protein
MKRIRPLFVVSVILALATLLPVAAFSAQEPNPTPDPSPAVVVEPEVTPVLEATPVPESCFDPETSSMDCFPNATPAPDTCWDCEGSTMTPEEGRAIYCSSAFLEEHPQMLDECFPDKWEWVCFTEDPARNITEHCEMYRRDLDPYGIFAPQPPPPTPGVPPTPVPTATPDPTPVPDLESPATPTP